MERMNKTLKAFFLHQLTIKMYHFQTKGYAAHKASDAYLVKFLANADQFMEVAQGKFDTTNLKSFDVKVETVTDKTIKTNLKQFAKILEKMSDDYKGHADILAIRDVMLADVNQLIYLLTFK
jgi:hypothetical protein